MKKEDIKTLDDALKFIGIVEGERDLALKGKKDAEVVANDAIEKANKATENAPKVYEAKVKGIGTVRVNFGVGGVSKDDLLNDHAKIAQLHKVGSGAITVVEPSKS